MKSTVKTSRTAGYLEKIFRAVNADSFGGEVEEPIITIQSTPMAYGHVTVSKVWKSKDSERYELNISADWLTRPIENVVATMIHEMVHLLNMQRGIQDCSRGNTYHNKKFKEEAEKHMLHIEKSEKYGWTITSPTDELLEYILDKGWGDIDMGKNAVFGLLGGSGNGVSAPGSSGKVTPGTDAKKKRTSWKHVCPKCGNIARTTKEIKLICGDCNENMEVED